MLINCPLFFTRMRQFSPFLLVLLGATVALISQLQALNFPFVSDDVDYIAENNKLADLQLTELWRLFIETYNPYEFLPIRDFSYWFDIALFGLDPAAFRLHNILLYVLCLPLVYGITLRLWRYFRPADTASAPLAAAVVTALFAVHPAHVEAVVWISGRKDLLSALFSLFALWLALSARGKRGFSAPYAAAVLVALLAAMLSKATSVAVAPVIALLWVIFWSDIPAPARRGSQLLWPFACLLLATCFAITFSANSQIKVPFYFGIEAITRAMAVLGWLARLAVSPESRHFFYPVFADKHLSAAVAAGVMVLVAALVGAVMIKRQRSLEGLVIVFFLLICMPYTQLVPFSTLSLASDRWLMLAVWPVIVLLVSLLWNLKPFPRTVLLLIIALPWAYQTMDRPRDWRNYETLTDTDLLTYPGYCLPAYEKIMEIHLPREEYRDAIDTANNISAPEFRNLAIRLIEVKHAVHVEAVNTGKTQKATSMLRKLGLYLERPPAQTNWDPPIDFIWRKSQWLITTEWEYLAKQFPEDVEVRYHAGIWILDDNNYLGALPHLRAAIESKRLPELVRGEAYYVLGLALMNSGQTAEAYTSLLASLEQLQPDFRAYCLLSKIYKQAGQIEEAAHSEAKCRKQTPNPNE